MKIHKKFLVVFVMVNLFFGLIYLNCFSVKADFISDMESNASKFVSTGEKEAKLGTGWLTSITGKFTSLGQLLTMVGAGVMVAVLSYMGIKYIMSPPDKQAALKQQLVGVLVAGIVIFGAYGIWSAVLQVVSRF